MRKGLKALAIFFVLRCVPLLANCAGHISFVDSPILLSFIQAMGWFDEVVSSLDSLTQAPSHVLPAMSAPFVMGLRDFRLMPCPELSLSFTGKWSNFQLHPLALEKPSRPVIALNW